MRVFISGDIEGISGIVSWSQCGRPNSDHFDYRWARERYTADMNAAIRGARQGGATEVVVKDSHGNSKNLLVDQLEPGTQLISGHGSTAAGMMAGIDRSFACSMLVGYHAMAGTQGGILEHTITGYVHRLWLNGKEIGEIGLSTGVAGCFDVPMVFISSDEAGCREAADLIPGIVTAPVKTGFGRYMGQCLDPREAEALIEAKAAEAVSKASALDPWLPDAPFTMRLEVNRAEQADQCMRIPGISRVDGYTVEFSADSYAAVHMLLWTVLAVAGVGTSAGE